MKFAAIGRTRWLLDAVGRAAAAGHEPVLIGTARAAPEYDVDERDFERLAQELGCPCFCDARIDRPEYRERLSDSRAEVAISVNWPTMIGPEVRAVFPHGVFNAHAGDLPRFRGNACPNWAILNGEKKVVLSLHRMVDELDAGPIFLQRALPLTDRTYVGDVYAFLDEAIPALFCELLDGIARGTLAPTAQPDDPALSLRTYPRLPRDSEIEWTQSSESIARLVRASAEPFGGATTFLDGERVRLWRARPASLPAVWLGAPGQVAERRPTGEVAVLTGDGVLLVEEIELDQGGRQPAARGVRSLRSRFGLDLAGEVLQLRRRVDDLERALAQRGVEPD